MASNRLSTQTVWTNEGISTFNVATLPYPGQLGMFYEKDGKKYQLVKLTAGAVAGAAGHAVFWADFDDFVVNNDISDDATAGRNKPAGVLQGTVTAGNYCFIQVRGQYSTVLTDGDDDIAAGDTLILDGTTDGSVDSVAAGTASTHVPFGIATAADVDANNTVEALLIMPLNGV